MAEVGYEKASIQVIAKEAGLTSGLIHYHFKTKQEILIAAVNGIVSLAEERLSLMQENKQSPWDRLEPMHDSLQVKHKCLKLSLHGS